MLARSLSTRGRGGGGGGGGGVGRGGGSPPPSRGGRGGFIGPSAVEDAAIRSGRGWHAAGLLRLGFGEAAWAARARRAGGARAFARAALALKHKTHVTSHKTRDQHAPTGLEAQDTRDQHKTPAQDTHDQRAGHESLERVWACGCVDAAHISRHSTVTVWVSVSVSQCRWVSVGVSQCLCRLAARWLGCDWWKLVSS